MVWVDENGTPADLALVSWSNVNTHNPDRLGLDQAAIAAIRNWRFVALKVAGKPARFQLRVGLLLHPTGGGKNQSPRTPHLLTSEPV